MSGWHWPWSEEAARLRAEARLRAHAWPAELVGVCEALAVGGHRALVVGGSVRDVLLARAGRGDWDVATSRTPEQVREVFPRVVGAGERHGTVIIALPGGATLECTTFRREGEYADARRPDQVWWTDDPFEDLARRDFTVNALAWDPLTRALLDPFGGARDLERRRLRAVGEPLDRFREDALRTLRAARFAATLEFELDERTRAALAWVGDRVEGVAIERVREELERMLTAPRPSVGFEVLREAGLLARWLPELAACRGVSQNRFHAHDVYFHSLYSCDHALPGKPDVRWAALLHDIGKPGTRAGAEGEATFHGHEALGARIADELLARLRFPTARREHIVRLVREHMFDYRPEWSDAAVRRFVRRIGVDDVADLFDLRLADSLGNGLKTPDTARLKALGRRIDALLRSSTALRVRDLAVDGATVMEVLGVPPGPAVGEALEALLDAVVEDPALNSREALCERLRTLRDAPGRP